ncbi:unnamed protein product [Lupinus luteus]|uniref:Uncharacterized protein n=1 Tax=Lupinus luteus TaxID=3873 RepID=A0AAV1WZJ5_LUPLU
MEVDVEGSVVGAEVQNGLAEPKLSDCSKEKEVPVERQVGSKQENFEETIHEPVIGEKHSAINSTDIAVDSNVISDMSGNELESKAEPSTDISNLKNIAAESKPEPSHQGDISVEGGNHGEADSRPKQEGSERTARVSFKSKCQELDSVKSTMNRLNNTISVGDIDNKIRNMEHMIQHETLPLNEEKQLIRQIKQLKQNRGEISSIIGKQDQSQQSTEQNDSIEEQTKRSVHLKKELDLLRNNLQKAETATKVAQKKYDDEWDKLSELQGRFNVADRIRQEAYTNLRALKSELHEKLYCVITKGQELAAGGKKEELQSFCIDKAINEFSDVV